ncbi:MAG: DUF4365 domain-containing protein [Saprospiraceae bacterium]|nr:DUF4365 domain-containing protein [Saprospiraceae bacterium]
MILPIDSHEKKLERESIDKLRLLFHQTNKFIVSSERGYDYGVDCSIELLNDEVKATNFNFHVQLKAIDKCERTAKKC